MSAKTKRILINFIFEMLIYGVLLVIYFWAVLRFLGEPLNQLFHLDPWVYAIATLLLIIAQGVLLEWITSFLVERLGIETLE